MCSHQSSIHLVLVYRILGNVLFCPASVSVFIHFIVNLLVGPMLNLPFVNSFIWEDESLDIFRLLGSYPAVLSLS